MTSSTSSGVIARTRLRLGTPALLTSTSVPPRSVSMRAARSASASSSPRSATHMRDSGEALRHCSRTSLSRSSRRAHRPTVAPASANASAVAAPMPDEAPVTMTFMVVSLDELRSLRVRDDGACRVEAEVAGLVEPEHLHELAQRQVLADDERELDDLAAVEVLLHPADELIIDVGRVGREASGVLDGHLL